MVLAMDTERVLLASRPTWNQSSCFIYLVDRLTAQRLHGMGRRGVGYHGCRGWVYYEYRCRSLTLLYPSDPAEDGSAYCREAAGGTGLSCMKNGGIAWDGDGSFA